MISALRGRGPISCLPRCWGHPIDLRERFLLAWAIVVFLTGCASGSPLESNPDASLAERRETASEAVATAPAEASQADESAKRQEADLVFRGTDESLRMPDPVPPLRLDGDAVMLNFEQAPLADVMHSILGETLGLDYVIDRPVQGDITIRTRSPIPREDLLPILESLLRNNDVVMVRGPNDRYFISGPANINATIPSYQSAPAGGYSNVIEPLQYIGANAMADILRPVAREDTFVRIDAGRNLLILGGTTLQLQGWMEIISTFDVDQLAGMSIGIFPLNNAAVSSLFTELEHILGGGAEVAGGSLSELVRVMPVERLNSILVVSPRQHYIDQVGEWIRKLDGAGDPASEPVLHVYEVRNGNSAQLASLLSIIYGGGGGVAPTAPGVATGLTPATSVASQTAGRPGGGAPTKPAQSAGALELGEGVRVVSDDYNNSLLVYAAPQEYRRIEAILSKLDVVATQVLIEASIVEVTLIDELEFGLEWAFSNNLGGGDSGSGLLNLTGAPIGPRAPGFSYTVTNSAGAVKAVLNALAEKSLVNVISTPSVMVLDNHTASIHVGDQQPIQSSSTITNGGNVQNSITYKDTGVKLEVTPSVNDGGLVTMSLSQSVTDVGVVDPATGQRSFLERNVASKVAIRSGESVVLGGLIRDNQSSGRRGVPLLMDIPGLGALFSTQSDTSTRTELLVFITPRVLEGEEDLRAINREMRGRMQGLTNFNDLPISVSGEEPGRL